MLKKIIGSLLVVILILCTVLPVTAYASETKTPSGIEYSELEDRIVRYIEEHKNTTASVSHAIFNGQDTLYQTHYGYTDIENKSLANDDTVYEWGSATKLLVWISVMQLWEQGKIDLDTDIAIYLPDGFLTKLSYDTPITMLNLMNHNAGWQETTYDVETGDVNRIVDLADALKQSEPKQIYEPGTVCAYSNWGCSLAGYIVEQISGQPFYKYVQENIFEPLGMTHTALAPDLSDNAWVQKQRQSLNCYYIDDDNYEDLGTCIRYILLYPSGMATGTLDDFLTFAKALMPSDDGQSSLFQNVGCQEVF